jgi:hypothetical protein
VTFFADECMFGMTFVGPLLAVGIDVERHCDHFQPGTPDTIWIPEIARRGWIGITVDKGTRQKYLEIQTILESEARMLVLPRRTGLKFSELALNFVNSRNSVFKFFDQCPAPCMGVLRRPSNPGDVAAGIPGRVEKRKLVLPEWW